MSQGSHSETPLPGRPKTPKLLHPNAAKKFVEVTKLIEEAGYISLLDSDIIALYANKWAEYWEHERTIALDGPVLDASNKYKQPHPCVAMRDQCERMLKQLGDSLGLNPKARAKLKLRAPVEETPYDDFGEE